MHLYMRYVLGIAMYWARPQALRPSPHQARPTTWAYKGLGLGLKFHQARAQGLSLGLLQYLPAVAHLPRRRDFFNLLYFQRPVYASPSTPLKARRLNFSLFSVRIPAHTVDVAPAPDEDVSRSSLIFPRL
ncbi:hypothetical protein M405DRAFT_481230 [Rhizopogon salebrosus TDB-379]|nr:hypothetical protein M405DRAFT_481230 [Rhizopogon salebrosus TDB-379]